MPPQGKLFVPSATVRFLSSHFVTVKTLRLPDVFGGLEKGCIGNEWVENSPFTILVPFK